MTPQGTASDGWCGGEYRKNTAHHRSFDPAALWRLDAGPGDSLLDVGCGAGDLTVAIAEHYPHAEVIGIDASPSQIRQARRHRHPRVRFEVARVQDLRWEERFAAVTSVACLHWIPLTEHPVALERIHACLVPGGRLIASFAAEDNIAEIRRIILSVATRSPFDRYLRGRPAHHPWPSLDGYREMMERSPFGSAEQLRTETQLRPFSLRRLLGWLRTQALTGYRAILPAEVFDDLTSAVGEQVADLTRTGPDHHIVPFVRLQLQARRAGEAVRTG